jgi:hypothetical protein
MRPTTQSVSLAVSFAKTQGASNSSLLRRRPAMRGRFGLSADRSSQPVRPFPQCAATNAGMRVITAMPAGLTGPAGFPSSCWSSSARKRPETENGAGSTSGTTSQRGYSAARVLGEIDAVRPGPARGAWLFRARLPGVGGGWRRSPETGKAMRAPDRMPTAASPCRARCLRRRRDHRRSRCPAAPTKSPSPGPLPAGLAAGTEHLAGARCRQSALVTAVSGLRAGARGRQCRLRPLVVRPVQPHAPRGWDGNRHRRHSAERAWPRRSAWTLPRKTPAGAVGWRPAWTVICHEHGTTC